MDIELNGITPMRCPCQHNRVVTFEEYHDGDLVRETVTLSDFGGWTCTLPDGFWFWATPTYIPPSFDVQGRRQHVSTHRSQRGLEAAQPARRTRGDGEADSE